MLTSF